jgi:DNA-binding transcriptional regulator LsrR (DeoR family)
VQNREDSAQFGLLGEVARLYYTAGKSQKEIALRIGRDPSVVVRLLREARDRGVVSFDIDTSVLARGVLDVALSRRLRDEFSLDEATAITVNRSDWPDEHARDDHLHRVLGNEIGKKIAARIRSRDHIAVGSGRAVQQTVRMISRTVQTQRGMLVTPLSGRIWTHVRRLSDGSSLERPLDSDDAAAILAGAFRNEPDTRYAQVSHSIYCENSVQAHRFMAEDCPFAFDGEWANWAGPPQIAIVGLGTLNAPTGHRLVDLFQSQPPEAAIHPQSSVNDLRTLIETIRRNNLPEVGDLTNRLFPLLPLPEEIRDNSQEQLKELTKGYQRLNGMIERFNSRAIVVDWSHLRRSGSVVAVAGGRGKIKALWTLLLPGCGAESRRVVKDLCTDTESASLLCEAIVQLRNVPPQVREFYEETSSRLFVPGT